MAEAAGAFYAVETLLEGAVAAVKGIYDPTLPLKATLTPVNDVSIPRRSHSVSMVRGRAYIFGGVTTDDNGIEVLADNSMHIIILPISATEGSDFKTIPATGDAPPPRYGHAAAVIDDQILVFGGASSISEPIPLDEDSAVWAFDTKTSKWTKLQPNQAPKNSSPQARFGHAAVATTQPRKPFKRTDEGLMPQVDADPARPDILPEPEEPNSFGTLIVTGGRVKAGEDAEPLNDVWAFDLRARAWGQLPSPSQLTLVPSADALAQVGNTLYTLVGGHAQAMELVAHGVADQLGGVAPPGLTALSPWAALERSSPSAGPGERHDAKLHVVTTGQGRNYLLLIGGGQGDGDIWTLQLRPEDMTAASIKDKARMVIGKNTGEKEWAEVKYYNAEGVMVQEGQGGRGIGAREAFASTRDAEEDGGTVFIHGGVAGGKIRGDGILISVSI